MTKMYVNLNNIKYNLENIKSKLKEGTNIIAMVIPAGPEPIIATRIPLDGAGPFVIWFA